MYADCVVTAAACTQELLGIAGLHGGGICTGTAVGCLAGNAEVLKGHWVPQHHLDTAAAALAASLNLAGAAACCLLQGGTAAAGTDVAGTVVAMCCCAALATALVLCKQVSQAVRWAFDG